MNDNEQMSPRERAEAEIRRMLPVLRDIIALAARGLDETSMALLAAVLGETAIPVRAWLRAEAIPTTCSVCGCPFECEPAAISGCRAPDELECSACWQQAEADADELAAEQAAVPALLDRRARSVFDQVMGRDREARS